MPTILDKCTLLGLIFIDLEFNLEVIFPHCWDGVNLESADQSHVTYTDMCDEELTCFHWPCPASHPVKIPEINLFLEIYDYEGGAHTFADGTDVSKIVVFINSDLIILAVPQ